jgi:hypothetical protein
VKALGKKVGDKKNGGNISNKPCIKKSPNPGPENLAKKLRIPRKIAGI